MADRASDSTDRFRLLAHMTWRGVVYPLSARSVSFRHENAEHAIQYRSNDFPEPLGPHSFLFRYTIPMRDGLARGPYKNLFNEGLTQLVRDCRDKEPGELYDPIYGTFRCIPTSFEETIDVNKRDGTDVQLDLLHAPHIDDGEPALLETITGIQGLASQAGLLDEQVQAADWKQTPSPRGMTSLLGQINGVGARGLRQIQKVSAKFQRIAYEAKAIEDTADAVENPANWGVRDASRALRDQAIQAQRRITENPLRKLRRVAVPFAKTIGAIAADAGMTLQELIELNPGLGARGPMIPAGTQIVLFKNANVRI